MDTVSAKQLLITPLKKVYQWIMPPVLLLALVLIGGAHINAAWNAKLQEWIDRYNQLGWRTGSVVTVVAANRAAAITTQKALQRQVTTATTRAAVAEAATASARRTAEAQATRVATAKAAGRTAVPLTKTAIQAAAARATAKVAGGWLPIAGDVAVTGIMIHTEISLASCRSELQRKSALLDDL